jgi:hypothetical protein
MGGSPYPFHPFWEVFSTFEVLGEWPMKWVYVCLCMCPSENCQIFGVYSIFRQTLMTETPTPDPQSAGELGERRPKKKEMVQDGAPVR